MRMAAGSFGILILSLLASSGAHAQQVITLAELERQAVENRPALDADDAASRGAQAEVDRARAAFYPVISLEGKTGVAPGNELRKLPCTVEGDETCEAEYFVSATREDLGVEAFKPVVRYGLGLEAKMSLYDFGRTSASVEA